jgi:GT2 family glycosyltransferase
VAESATVVYVAFGARTLDLTWVPTDAPVVVVHNDDLLAQRSFSGWDVTHVRPGSNVGFGAGVNAALSHVVTERVVLVNPDVDLEPHHLSALAGGNEDELVTIPLVDQDGRPNSIVNRYPTALVAALTGYRAGRLAPRGSRLRSAGSRLVRGWGADHHHLTITPAGSWSLQTHWASGAAVGIPAQRLRAVGGFSSDYFLYMEDVDLCRRLGQRFPDMEVRIAEVSPGRHAVGGAAVGSGARNRDRSYVASIRTYVARQKGVTWRIAGLCLWARAAWLARS